MDIQKIEIGVSPLLLYKHYFFPIRRDREEAIVRMKRALEEFVIEGVKTTIPFHRYVLENEYFRKGDFYTNFVEEKLMKEAFHD
ncbi:unnamed protein product [marine sediment metagenome]|uniref:Biotin carboxylation domain-containing protein n=1 Tax=marine sediment metagenome TaxID=412755 RepID=X1HA01_9ZZZZ